MIVFEKARQYNYMAPYIKNITPDIKKNNTG
jgi:hypothetical protein